MKHSPDLKLNGKVVVLVPYRKNHVVKYHEWMTDDEILRLTGSERLTLSQEYEMQKSWEDDNDKCTFIILDRAKLEETTDEVASMIGDTNIFLNNTENPSEGEIEIMIAEKSSRRKGCATEALNLMMKFGSQALNLKRYVAKIKEDNISSINMFHKLGFIIQEETNVFKEITMTYEFK